MPKQILVGLNRYKFDARFQIVVKNTDGSIFGPGYLIEKYDDSKFLDVCWSYRKDCGFSQQEPKLIQ